MVLIHRGYAFAQYAKVVRACRVAVRFRSLLGSSASVWAALPVVSIVRRSVLAPTITGTARVAAQRANVYVAAPWNRLGRVVAFSCARSNFAVIVEALAARQAALRIGSTLITDAALDHSVSQNVVSETFDE